MPAKKHIATITVGAGGAANITFASIPQAGTDLLVEVSTGPNAGNQSVYLLLNGASTSFSSKYLYGSGTAVASGTRTDNVFQGLTGSATAALGPSNGRVLIPNYAGTSNKAITVDTVWEQNGSTAFQWFYAGQWAQTSAVTSLQLTAVSLFTEGSTASLYMFTKGSGGASVA